MKLIDVVGYLLDARAPFSCFNPAFKKVIGAKPCVFILNKTDLADDKTTSKWEKYFSSQGLSVVKVISTQTNTTAIVKSAFAGVHKKNLEKFALKGVYRPTRAMILGVPNCGKSTLINALSGKRNAIVGDKPGVTKGKQWIRLAEGLELLDTPGTLWNKFEDQTIAQNLLFVGSINDAVVDVVEASCVLLDRLTRRYSETLKSRYKLTSQDLILPTMEILNRIGKNRGCLLKGEIDTLRVASLVCDEFKKGKLGKITLETPEDYNLI